MTKRLFFIRCWSLLETANGSLGVRARKLIHPGRGDPRRRTFDLGVRPT
jgi:hypothetical protein